MNYSTAVMLINPEIRAIRGKYESDTTVTTVFKTTLKDLAVDDLVVVESSTRWGMTVVKVTAIDAEVDFDSTQNVGWVVQKVSVPEHNQLKAMETAAIDLIKKGELRKRREDIKKNTLDAYSAGEIDNLAIARLGVPTVEPQA